MIISGPNETMPGHMPAPINGYYTVNKQVYNNKFEALLASTKNGCQVHWHWHPEYDRINWQADTTVSVKEIYRLRAQQLRDKYNYLVLSFSGGADSWQVLHTFLSNNIKLDEVFVRWPISATEKLYQPNSTDKRSSNILSEWDYAIKPTLEMLQTHHPDVRITVKDISKDILDTEYTDNLITQSHEIVGAGWWAKFGSMPDQERKLIDNNGSVAFIMGIDKPQIRVKNNQVYCYFLDTIVNSTIPPYADGRCAELFYWTRDMPEVTYVQARAIYNHMKMSPAVAQLLQFGGNFDSARKYQWDLFVKSIIYSDYGSNVFQAMKTHNVVYNPVDAWLLKVIDSRSLQAWESMVENIRLSLDQRYIKYDEHNTMSGVASYISQEYYLGDLPTTTL